MECLFCRIMDRKAPAKIIYEDERAVAIEDIHPQAPVHLLVLPRKHLASLREALPEDEALLDGCGPLEVRSYPIDPNQRTEPADLDPGTEPAWTLLMALAACRAEAFRLISGEVLPARTFIGRLMVSRTGCDSV